MEIYDRKEGVYQTEKKRLNKLEDALAYSQQRAKGQEDEILKLVKLVDKTNLENEIKALKTDFNRKIMEYWEELDEVKSQNALFQNEISSLNSYLTNLTQEHEDKINILKEEVFRKHNEIALAIEINLTAKSSELMNTNKELNKVQNKLNQKTNKITVCLILFFIFFSFIFFLLIIFTIENFTQSVKN